jgi:hypothetical protein
LTADSRRDRSSKFGPFGRRVTARRGGPDGQPDTQPKSRAQSGLLADFGGHGANGHFPYESSNQANPEGRTNAENWANAEARTNAENWASPESRTNAEGWTSPEAQTNAENWTNPESQTNAEGWTYREGFTSPGDQTDAEGWTYREGFTSPESQTNAEGWTYREGLTYAEDGAPRTRDRESGAGGEPTLILNAGRRTGRHAGQQVKADRKRKLRKVIPAAAVVAVVAAGTAAYGLTSGGSHAMRSNAAATLPGTLDALGASPSSTNAAGTKLVKVATAKAATAARPAVKPTPKPTASSKPSAASPAASSAASAPADAASSAPADAASSGTTTSNAPATQAAAPSATPAASQSATATTVSCNLNSGGLLPQNVTAIVNFLLANGYSDNAAAGIAGNTYQESGGNPEAVGDGGGGLIGFTPLPSGYVTGDATADLQTQLNAVLTYNQIWASYIPALNAATSPSDAADIYVTDFERAGIPATATREASAEDVASACGL